MKTIEERAKEYKKRYFSKANDLFQSVAKVAYIVGAEEQKVIDIDKTIDKAVKWLRDKLYNYLWTGEDGSINVTTDLFNDFTKAMEE